MKKNITVSLVQYVYNTLLFPKCSSMWHQTPSPGLPEGVRQERITSVWLPPLFGMGNDPK